MELSAGILLLSDPFLKDPNFVRSVVLLCEHNDEGSFGFVLNKKTKHTLYSLVEKAVGLELPVYEGGPVEHNTLHFIHRKPDLIADGIEIAEGIYWGGDFEQVVAALQTNILSPTDVRFFMGYSGWSTGQLAEEYEEKSWIVAAASSSLIFSYKESQLWKQSLTELGGEYARMTNYPSDPQLN